MGRCKLDGQQRKTPTGGALSDREKGVFWTFAGPSYRCTDGIFIPVRTEYVMGVITSSLSVNGS